jgi:hypothetical protein
MPELINWAAAKVSASGSFIGSPYQCASVSKTGTGVYEVVLSNPLGDDECCPQPSPCYTPGVDSVPETYCDVGLKNDGVTLVVDMLTVVAGVVTHVDGAFCITVHRIMP